MTMRTLSTKVDNSVHDQALARCNGIGCSVSKYIADLIDKDLAGDEFIPHKSNPDIKLIKSIEENGEIRYIDTDGNKWLMKDDLTLIPIGRIYRVSLKESDENGSPRQTWYEKENGVWIKIRDSSKQIPIGRIVVRDD